ncbi:hypothetical protein EON63_04750 [archaeon]|nr:MAG: hypothetical protein EON63_04750 [archaeon]
MFYSDYASSSSAFAIKTEPHSPCPSDIDDDHCDDNNPPRKTSRCDHSTNKHKSKATNPLPTDPHDLQMYQKIERRERNREHAKKSRVRKKVLLDTLQDQLLSLRRENMVLRRVVIDNIPQAAARILQECTTEESSLLLNNNISDTEDNDKPSHSSGPLSSSAYRPSRLTSNIAAGMRQSHTNTPTASSNLDPTVSSKLPYPSGFSFSNQVKQQAKILMEPDYRLIQSLVSSQQNFVLSDPSIPDNPIVYASEGFCKMTGYKKNDVLGMYMCMECVWDVYVYYGRGHNENGLVGMRCVWDVYGNVYVLYMCMCT